MFALLVRWAGVVVFLTPILGESIGLLDPRVWAAETLAVQSEFSGVSIRQVSGKKQQAQVYAKRDRLRLEYKYAVRTKFGYAAIEIIRLDQAQSWYLLAQRRELLVVPLDPDDVLPVRPELPGEHTRTFVGDASVAGRPAQLFDVHVDRHGKTEAFYEWVDVETGIVLKLVSRDRDWSFAYERIRFSLQPDYYFDEPPGYKKRMSAVTPRRTGW